MQRRLFVLTACGLAGPAMAQMPKLDDIMKGAGALPKTAGSAGTSDIKTDTAGIKEALAVGTERAVKSLGRENGYFGNAAVKILMPSSLQKVAEVAKMAGYQKQTERSNRQFLRRSHAIPRSKHHA